MLAERIHPDVVLEFWVSNGNMAGHALCEAFAREIAKHSGGVDEDVFAMFSVGREFWDAWKRCQYM